MDGWTNYSPSFDKYLQAVLVFKKFHELSTMKRLGKMRTTDKDLPFLKLLKCILLIYVLRNCSDIQKQKLFIPPRQQTEV